MGEIPGRWTAFRKALFVQCVLIMSGKGTAFTPHLEEEATCNERAVHRAVIRATFWDLHCLLCAKLRLQLTPLQISQRQSS